MRLVALAVAASIVAAPFLATTPASACAQPVEGDCYCEPYLFETTVAGHYVAIPGPSAHFCE